MHIDKQRIKTYSNIRTDIPSNVLIKAEMIIDTTGEKPVLNLDYWKAIKEPINVVIDEAHTVLNARKAMSKVNVVMTDWIALIRRVVGEDARGQGELVLITQLPNRIDIICREMATQVRYHVCHFTKHCLVCGSGWYENSEMPEPAKYCPFCGAFKMQKSNYTLEIKHFHSMQSLEAWKFFGMNTYYKHYFVRDVEQYFPMYDTLQWDNLISEVY